MNTVVNLFHPHLEQSRVNRAWGERLASESSITVRRLYELYPDGKINVALEQAVLEAHDRIVFQHPLRWYSVPPLMKQWLDDVLTYGWAYGSTGKALHGKEWLSCISTGGPADSYQAGAYNHYAMSEILKPLQQTANLIGMTYLPPFILHGADSASPAQIQGSAETMLAHVLDARLNPQLKLAALLAEIDAETSAA
ncbi:NAD(P)H-dependent oxidoreductase [Diaphorobacter sp. HDW4B]|uniref:NAD(P)H-dependent oxidoreductase n=1 Tax=Diaphorobacter sp. HDW4B TaxID=2714925 RepID=UPI00140CF861|nr:NAD(P)H-dependent oxidoreductase [Diaphorobacter sp. HDW4B]QIL69194.1 NAD(P)H-dependent oxidoreductase [Diaphorobacter sp. HDW4B]